MSDQFSFLPFSAKMHQFYTQAETKKNSATLPHQSNLEATKENHYLKVKLPSNTGKICCV